MSSEPSNINDLKKIIDELRTFIENQPLDEHTKNDLYVEVEVIEEQLEGNTPTAAIIHTSLHNIVNIVKGNATNFAEHDVPQRIIEFLGNLGIFF